MGTYRSKAAKRRYDPDTVGLLLAVGLLILAAAGIVLARVWL